MKIDTTLAKELPLEFKGQGEVRGFNFTQVAKTDKGYIYKVSYGYDVWYEAFRRKINAFGGVSYPKSKSFGVWAKSFKSLEKATEYLNLLK